MPELTIASALLRTICSFTLQANLFQLFQPIGGVRARPFGPFPMTSWVVSAVAAEVTLASANRQANQCSALLIHPSPPLLLLR
jgi:hypothetical protein